MLALGNFFFNILLCFLSFMYFTHMFSDGLSTLVQCRVLVYDAQLAYSVIKFKVCNFPKEQHFDY